jgi:hypothetical protein
MAIQLRVRGAQRALIGDYRSGAAKFNPKTDDMIVDVWTPSP